jgi:hypothetical protein
MVLAILAINIESMSLMGWTGALPLTWNSRPSVPVLWNFWHDTVVHMSHHMGLRSGNPVTLMGLWSVLTFVPSVMIAIGFVHA